MDSQQKITNEKAKALRKKKKTVDNTSLGGRKMNFFHTTDKVPAREVLSNHFHQIKVSLFHIKLSEIPDESGECDRYLVFQWMNPISKTKAPKTQKAKTNTELLFYHNLYIFLLYYLGGWGHVKLETVSPMRSYTWFPLHDHYTGNHITNFHHQFSFSCSIC